MEPRKQSKPGWKVPVIFGVITSYQIDNILEHNRAKNRESKAVFLIRDSSTYPGLATVSYYSQELDMVKNIRFGLTQEGWKSAPTPPQEPNITDTAEIKARYKQEKEKFDKEMINFLSTAKKLFEQNATDDQIKSLNLELKRNEFKLDGLIKPYPEQASQEKHFTTYVSASFISEELSSTIRHSANKYTDW